ncbi:hypothetical protein BFJ69_g8468 [Fusarium oxysporum]|uniref:Uncharacterized protein n=1 Tax=Fusarium oxysporum TaxID=5507 RepID=A0A420N2R2_FUSOX|nr:hypothetical protein BFJ69_g8468 [Fusarium oxysporum]
MEYGLASASATKAKLKFKNYSKSKTGISAPARNGS